MTTCAQLLPLVRFVAADAVYPKMCEATGTLDLKTYPHTLNARTLIRYGSEVCCSVALRAGEPWRDVLVRMCAALVPTDVVSLSDVTTLVLCFDTPAPHATRVTHPMRTVYSYAAIQRASGADRATVFGGAMSDSDGDSVPDFVNGYVAAGATVIEVLMRPMTCARFYAALLDAVALNAPLTAELRIVLDGMDGGVARVLYHDATVHKRTLTRATDPLHSGFALITWPTGPRDADDCIALWTELMASNGVVVESGADTTALRLLARAELQTCRAALWFVHRRDGGTCDTTDTGDAQGRGRHCGQARRSEPHEYVDVRLAVQRLRKAYNYGMAQVFAPHTVMRPAPLIMPVLALLLLSFYGADTRALTLRYQTCAAVCAHLMTRVTESHGYRGLLATPGPTQTGSLLLAPGCLAPLRVAVAHDQFERLYKDIIVLSHSPQPTAAAAAARAAVALHRLYNGHLAAAVADDAAQWGYATGDDGAPVLADDVDKCQMYCV